MKRLLSPTVCLLLLFSASLRAQVIEEAMTPPPFESFGDGPRFYIDYATFQGLEKKTYSEFYIQVGYRDLQFVKRDNGFEARYEVELTILDHQNNVVENQITKDAFQVATFAETDSKKRARVSLTGFTFEPGIYKILAVMTDLETQHFTTINQPFQVKHYDADAELMISDIQLSQKIEAAEEGQPYVKNQRYIEPNAVRSFVHGMNDIYIYFEAYNLIKGCEEEYSNYLANFIIHDEEGKQYANIRRRHAKPGETSAHSIKLPVDHFLEGRYTLTVLVIDEDTGRQAESKSEFFVFDNPLSANPPEYYEQYR